MPREISYLPERMQLLELGEKLGWPRLPYGPRRVIRAGKGPWETFARAPRTHLFPALRNAKIRVENMGGVLESESDRVMLYKDRLRYGEGEVQVAPVPVVMDEGRVKMLLNLERARAARAAKKAARVAV